MLRSVWLIVSIMAVAHVLAIGGFVGWLLASDRLDGGRVERVRTILAQTIRDEQKAEEERAAEQAKLDAEAGTLPPHGPRTAAELASLKLEVSEVDRQRIEDLKGQIDVLRLSLQNERRQLDRERESFEAERTAFESMRTRLEEIEGEAQFRKAVTTLEGLKPAQARETLNELLRENGRAQVVAYLNAMDERLRTKVLAEFITAGEAAVAADLLEQIRTKGLEPLEPETLADATP